VTVVFSDITRAASLWEFNPEAMRDATVLHNEILRGLLRKCQGYEIAFHRYLTHPSPPDAAAAVLTHQCTKQGQEQRRRFVLHGLPAHQGRHRLVHTVPDCPRPGQLARSAPPASRRCRRVGRYRRQVRYAIFAA
jgi:hypothetical protein